MAAKSYFSLLVCGIAACICIDGFGQVGLASGSKTKAAQAVEPSNPFDSVKYRLREKVLSLAMAEVGVVERTGRNDHPRIKVYHSSVSPWLANYKPAQPYCASFVNYIMKSAGVKVTSVPNPARARDWFVMKKRIVMTQQSLRGNRRMMKIPERGSVVGYIFYGSAISHVEILDRVDLEGGYLYCVGANTSSRGSATIVNREGNGVFYVKRKLKMFYVIADVI